MRVSRRIAVLAGIVLAVLVLASTRTAWVTASVPDLVGGTRPLEVTGGKAAPGVVAMAVVALAAALLTSLAGRLLARITGIVASLSGAASAWLALDVLRDPAAHASGEAASSAGLVSGAESARATIWPILSAIPALLLVPLGLLILWRSAAWSTTGRFARDAAAPAGADAPGTISDSRGRRRAVPRDDSPAAAWDALSRGEDPTADGTDTQSDHRRDEPRRDPAAD